MRDFYEISPGDNTPPKVKTTAWITYDDAFLYVAIKCDDPRPQEIRAQHVERDHVYNDQDFAGIMLDARNDGRTGIEFFVNPYGIQDDFVLDESIVNGSSEDVAPDFHWDSAARITPDGWQLEIGIPFSSPALRQRGPPDVGDRRLPEPRARFPVPDREQPLTARVELLHLSCHEARWARRSSPRRPPRGRPVRDAHGNRRAAGRARIALPQRTGPRGRRPRRQVGPEREHGLGRGDQPRFLAGRVRRRTDFREQPVRALLSREAPVLHGAFTAFQRADPGHLHAYDHVSALGRAGLGRCRR